MIQTEKKTVLKRGLALLLTIVMLFGLLPATVFAAHNDITVRYQPQDDAIGIPTGVFYGDSEAGGVTMNAAPVRPGYKFMGWRLESSSVTNYASAGAAYTEVGTWTAIAQWQAENITVTFNLNGGDGANTTATVGVNTNIYTPAVPTKAGSTFGGWKADGVTTYGAGTLVTLGEANTTFVAQWNTTTPATTYTVKYVADTAATGMPSADVLTVEDGTLVALSAAPSKSGYIFTGWKSGATTYGAGQTVAVSADMTLEAQWQTETAPTVYTVKYVADATAVGMPSASVLSVLKGTLVALAAAPAKDGYIFGGWEETTSTTVYGAGETVAVTANMEFKAKWIEVTAPTPCEVTYVADASAIGMPSTTVLKVADGTLITLAAAPSKAGYTFAGWDDGTAVYGAGQTVAVTADMTLAAKWTENPVVTVTYAADATAKAMPSTTAMTYEKGAAITLASAPVKEYSLFLGWSDGTVTYAAGQTITVTADMTLTAQWEDISATLSYDSTGIATTTVLPTTQKYNKGDVVTVTTIIPDVTTDGEEFSYWTDTADTTVKLLPGASFTLTRAGATVLQAVTKPIGKNVVKFDVTAAAWITADSVDENGAPINNGADRNVSEGDSISFEIAIPVAYYNGTAPVVTAKDTVKNTQKKLAGALTGSDDNFYYYGYEFTPKHETTVIVGALSMNKYNVTLPVGEYTTAFTAPATSTEKIMSVAYGTDVTFTVAARDGYEIMGVYANGVQLTETAGAYTISAVKENTAVSVDVRELPTYAVVYMVKAGNNNSVYMTQYVVEGKTATAPVAPEIEGYTFDKWYTDEAYTTAYDFTTPVTAALTLYGKMVPQTFSVTYDENAPTGTTVDISAITTNPDTRTYGTPYVVTSVEPTITPDAYKFLGWATNAKATEAEYLPGDSIAADLIGDVTLYAVWEIVEFNAVLQPGTGYTIWTEQSTSLKYDDDFTFFVRFDKGYTEGVDETTAANNIKINDAKASTLANVTVTADTAADTANADDSLTFKVVITGVKEDEIISVFAGKNKAYTVTYKIVYVDSTMKKTLEEVDYFSQEVEWNTRATIPEVPAKEGYTFKGWYTTATYTDPTYAISGLYTFTEKVTSNITLYAEMMLDTIEVDFSTAGGDGYTVSYDTVVDVDYGGSLVFTVTVDEGYDGTNLVVSANGYALAPKLIEDKTEVAGDGTVVYTYELIGIKEDVRIDITGVERKTVMVVFNDAGGESGPVFQMVNYYIPGASDNTIIVKDPMPVKAGFDFIGWSVNPNEKPEEMNSTHVGPTDETLVGAYKKADLGVVEAQFQADTVVYAVWGIETIKVTIEADKDEYFEGEDMVLTSTVTHKDADGNDAFVSGGKVYFYMNGELLGSVDAEGGVATYTVTAADYNAFKDVNDVTFEAVFVPMSNVRLYTAYSNAAITAFDSATGAITIDGASYTATEEAKILSRSITWALDRDSTATPFESTIQDAAKAITVVDSDNNAYNDPFVAGDTYTLTIAPVYGLSYGVEDGTTVTATIGTPLTVGTDYYVVWQSKTATTDWADYVTVTDSDSVTVTPEGESVQYRALVYPVGTPSTVYDRAAKYDDNGKLVAETVECLVSDPTLATERKETKIEIHATNWYAYEGDEIYVTAYVTYENDAGETVGVDAGKVYFYQKTPADTDYTLIGVVDCAGGYADITATSSAYNAFVLALDNIDQFEAVYVPVGTTEYLESYTTAGVAFDAATTAIALDTAYVPEALHVDIFPRSLAWLMDRDSSATPFDYTIIDGADTITVTDSNGNDVTDEDLVAGNTYTLEIAYWPAELRLSYNDTITGDVPLTNYHVGEDFYIVWQIKDDSGDWKDIATVYDGKTITVTPDKETACYRAEIFPMGETYDRTAKYDANDKLVEGYTNCLVTKPTHKTERKATTITLKADADKYYEGNEINLTAFVTYVDDAGDTVYVDNGLVYLYQKTAAEDEYTLVATTEAAGGFARITVNASDYNAFELVNADQFEAVYVPVANDALASSYTSAELTFNKADATLTLGTSYAPAAVETEILSKSITWALTRTSSTTVDEYVITAECDTITVYDKDNNDVTGDPLDAGDKYTLVLSDVYALTTGYVDASTGDTVGTPLKVGNDFYIVWQSRVDEGDWADLTTVKDSMSVVVTPESETTQYRALVYPVGAPETEFDRAAEFNDEDKLLGTAVECLVSKPTEKTERKPVVITLTSDKDEYAEGEDIVLTALVTYQDANNETVVVESGMVYFYHKLADATEYELIATEEAKGGYAYFTIAASDYNAFAVLNADDFEAVYVPVANKSLKYGFTDDEITFNKADASIETSASYVPATVRTRIDSRAITWALDRTATDVAGAITPDSYKITEDANVLTIKNEAGDVVTVMVANEQYTLTIPTVYGLTWGYTDVADGTAVVSNELTVGNDYQITWQFKNDHGDWEDYVTITDTDTVTITPEYSKYQFRAKVTPLVGDTSIYTKGADYDANDELLTSYTNAIYTVATPATIQNTVTVVVTALDEIEATATVVDVYQCNEITLRAEVTADFDPIKPEGTVTFYYVDEAGNEVKIETADLIEDGNATDGYVYTAEIVTDVLPVRDDGTHQKVEIYAIYTENDTFEEKDSRDDLAAPEDGCFVYVMSSVINVDEAYENLINHDTTYGNIYITVDGARDDGPDVEDPVANDTRVTLRLSDIFTRDVLRTDWSADAAATEVPDAIKLLADGEHYEVKWQKLSNAVAYLNDDGTVKAGIDDREVPWTDVEGQIGTSCHITPEDGAAYRAVITALDTPATKGSYTQVENPVAGRRTYYSNILLVVNGETTLAFYLNSSDVDDEHKGVLEGEKVFVQIFESGATATTPISHAEVVIAKDTDGDGDPTTGTPEVVFDENTIVTNGYGMTTWETAEPGYYFVQVNAEEANNGFDAANYYQRVIVRDGDYTITVDDSTTTTVYNGQIKAVDFTVEDMDIESELANKVWTVSYYKADGVTTDPATGEKNYGNAVEPRLAGDYVVVATLAESAFWVEQTVETTLTIEKRPVKVVDLVANVKYYNGAADANLVEITLNDAVTDQAGTGLPTDDKGLINGDIVYVIGSGYTTSVNAGATQLGVKNAVLAGTDADNYVIEDYSYTEAFEIERNQLYGVIVPAGKQEYGYSADGKVFNNTKFTLYDQYGTVIDDPQVIYYYHNGQGIEKVENLLYRGVYTVIVTMDQNNYKGGLTTLTSVGSSGSSGVTASCDPAHTVLTFSDTVTLYNKAGNAPVKVTSSLAGVTTTVYYNVAGAWTTTVPADAGRYLVKAEASTGDVAYGLYNVLKSNPEVTFTAEDKVYDSELYSLGLTTLVYSGTGSVYYTFAGDTVKGKSVYDVPTEVGNYVITAHINESDNEAAYEVSANFSITPATLEVSAGHYARGQYMAFDQFIPEYKGIVDANIPDTSLRNVDIAPEIVFNMTDGIANFDNDALDQVGRITLTVAAGLAHNYEIVYHDGEVITTAADPNETLVIKGMPQSDNSDIVTYYGDVFRVYSYGNTVDNVTNTSSLYTWSVDDSGLTAGSVTIDQNGLVKVEGVGDYSITLTRGYGVQAISTTIDLVALPQELKIEVPEQNYVYDDTVKTYDVSEMVVYDAMYDEPIDYTYLTAWDLDRTEVGTQTVLAQVDTASAIYYQSEIYGGYITVNDKDVTVTPNPGTNEYGTPSVENSRGYTEDGTVTGVDALTDGYEVALTDSYANLDVGADRYEVIVAGRENKNYNVKYITNAADGAGRETVTKKALTVTSGVYSNLNGRTLVTTTAGKTYYNDYLPTNGGSLMKVNYRNITKVFDTLAYRMYGEHNHPMAIEVTGLIDGDCLADLAQYSAWLDRYYNAIDEEVRGATYTTANANIHYNSAETFATATDIASRAGLAADYYNVINNNTMVDFNNYEVTYVEGEELIYQRPVLLKVTEIDGTDPAPDNVHLHYSYKQDSSDNYAKLRELLVTRLLKVEKFNDKGGLAVNLDHTIDDLKLKFVFVEIDQYTLEVHVTVQNENYWLANDDPNEEFVFLLEFDKYSFIVDYENTLKDADGDCFTRGYSIVTLFYVDGNLDGEVIDESLLSRSYLPNDDKLYCYIYRFKKNGNYEGETPLYIYEFKKVDGQEGVYRCDYKILPTGNYCMFAVTESDVYTLINDKNH